MLPPDMVKDYMDKANKGIVYNSSMIQDKESVLCGYYCLYFIMGRHNGRRMIDIILDFTQKPSEFNEWFISHFGITI